jgi:hypothetical protein
LVTALVSVLPKYGDSPSSDGLLQSLCIPASYWALPIAL